MAIAVVEWAFKHSRSKNGARLVMLAIADSCNRADGTGAYPSIPELMSKTNLSERAVQDGTKALVALGELKVELQAGPGGHNRYCVVMNLSADSAPPQDPPPADSAPPADSSETPADSAPGGADSAPGTNNEPKENHSPPSGESAHASTRARGQKSNGTKTKTAAPPKHEKADHLADEWWKRYKATTAQSFIAIRQVLRTALANGLDRDDVARAIDVIGREGRAISGGSIQTALQKIQAARGSPNGKHAPGSGQRNLPDPSEYGKGKASI